MRNRPVPPLRDARQRFAPPAPAEAVRDPDQHQVMPDDLETALGPLRTSEAQAQAWEQRRLQAMRAYIRQRIGPLPWVQRTETAHVLSVERAARTCTVRVPSQAAAVTNVEYGLNTPTVGQSYRLHWPVHLPAAPPERGIQPQAFGPPWLKVPGGSMLYWMAGTSVYRTAWPLDDAPDAPELVVDVAVSPAASLTNLRLLGLDGQGNLYVVSFGLPARLYGWTERGAGGFTSHYLPAYNPALDSGWVYVNPSTTDFFAQSPPVLHAVDATPGATGIVGAFPVDPATYTQLDTRPRTYPQNVQVLYSDDGGASWQVAQTLPFRQESPTTAVLYNAATPSWGCYGLFTDTAGTRQFAYPFAHYPNGQDGSPAGFDVQFGLARGGSLVTSPTLGSGALTGLVVGLPDSGEFRCVVQVEQTGGGKATLISQHGATGPWQPLGIPGFDPEDTLIVAQDRTADQMLAFGSLLAGGTGWAWTEDGGVSWSSPSAAQVSWLTTYGPAIFSASGYGGRIVED